MKVAMAVATIAAGLFIALGVIFIICSLKSIKNSAKNETRIKGLEDSLENMGKLISERTDYLAAKLEEGSIAKAVQMQQEAAVKAPEPEYIPEVNIVNTIPTEKSNETEEIGDIDEISIEDLFDDDFEDLLAEEPAAAAYWEITAEPAAPDIPAKAIAIGEEASFRQAEAAVQAQAAETVYPPSKHHMGYDVGRSGRKYTASELEDLIRA